MQAIKLSAAVAVVTAVVLTGVGTAAAITNVPAGTTPVSVSAGGDHTGIDAGMHPAGAIAGKLTSARTGQGIASAGITAFNTANHATTTVFTASDGTFSVKGLRTGNYAVCASTYPIGSSFGYVNRCHGSTAQFTGASPSGGASAIHVNTGQQVSNKNIALPDAGRHHRHHPLGGG